MKTTDFDQVLAGMSAEDSRRLHRVLAEWARGDEGSFPVQLALITRAQWRVAATVPKLLEEQRRLLATELAEIRRVEAEAAERILEAQRVQLTKLEAEVLRATNALRETGARQHVEWGTAVAVANEIRVGLKEGADCWKQARGELREQQRELGAMVVSLREERELERSWTFWFVLGLIALLGFGAGIIAHTEYLARQAAKTLATAAPR